MSEQEIIEPTKARELIAVPPVAGSGVRPIIPSTMEELKYMAGLVIGSGLAPDSYQNDPKKIAIGIMKGLEVGLAPLMALANIAIINGRPSIWGDGAMALVQSKNVIEKFEVFEVGRQPSDSEDVDKFQDTYGFEARIWRKGQDAPYIGKFTVGDARRAKLWLNPKRPPWMMYPKRMLKIRASAFALRDGFADCLAGLNIREEVEDTPAPPKAPDVAFLEDKPILPVPEDETKETTT